MCYYCYLLQRPIVAFSIENKTILNIKQKRLGKTVGNLVKAEDRSNFNKKSVSNDGNIVEEKKSFVGVTSKPGNVKMRNRFKLGTQAKIHGQMVHKAKLKQKKKMQVVKEKIKDSKVR